MKAQRLLLALAHHLLCLTHSPCGNGMGINPALIHNRDEIGRASRRLFTTRRLLLFIDSRFVGGSGRREGGWIGRLKSKGKKNFIIFLQYFLCCFSRFPKVKKAQSYLNFLLYMLLLMQYATHRNGPHKKRRTEEPASAANIPEARETNTETSRQPATEARGDTSRI